MQSGEGGHAVAGEPADCSDSPAHNSPAAVSDRIFRFMSRISRQELRCDHRSPLAFLQLVPVNSICGNVTLTTRTPPPTPAPAFLPQHGGRPLQVCPLWMGPCYTPLSQLPTRAGPSSTAAVAAWANP